MKKQFSEMGIARKNFLGISLMMLTTILCLAGFLYYGMPIYYNQSQRQELRTNYTAVLKELNGLTEADMIAQLAASSKRYPSLYFTLSDESGALLYPAETGQNSEVKSDFHDINEQGNEVGFWTDSVMTKNGQYMILLGQYAYPSLSGFGQTLLTLAPFIILLLIGTTVGVAALYSRLATRRIKLISKQTRRMSFLEEGVLCPTNGQDEIALLGQDINSLYKNLLQSIKDLEIENNRTATRERERTEFLRMTAHELKTPITSMMGIVEGMLYGVGDFKDKERYLEVCRKILQEQSELVQSVLEATNVDLAAQKGAVDFSLTDMLVETLTSYEALAVVNEYDFSVELAECRIYGNPLYFQKAVKNILDNAFRYTKHGGAISVVLTQQKLVVRNQAERLLDKEQLRKVFQPFYRPDFSRDRKDGGTGVGLYMVEQILSQHGFPYHFFAEKEDMVFCIELL